MKVISLIIPNAKMLLTISLRSASAPHKRQRYQTITTHTHPASAAAINRKTRMQKFEPVTHVIFDMDGVLLDTEKIYYNVMEYIAKSFGKEYLWEIRMQVLGTSEQDCAKIMVKELSLPITAAEFHQKQKEVQAWMLKEAQLIPGADRLLRHLHKSGVPMAVATSSGKESVEVKTANYKELFSCFHHFVCGSSDPEVSKGKPAPDIFRVAASRFPDKPHPSKCLVFEDAPNGLKAGVAAGMQVVMIPDSRTKEEDRKGATMVLNKITDFKPELFGLPPFPKGKK